MKLVIGSVTLATLFNSGLAASAKYEKVFSELQGCSVSFGSCIHPNVLFVPVQEAECLKITYTDPETNQVLKGEWFKAYKTSDEFEADPVSAGAPHYTRIPDGQTVRSFLPTIAAAGAKVQEYLFCDGSTYITTDKVVPSAEISIPIPAVLRLNPVELSSNSKMLKSKFNGASVLLKSTSDASAVKKVWEKRHEERRRLEGANAPELSLSLMPTVAHDASPMSQLLSVTLESDLKWIAEQPESLYVDLQAIYTNDNFDAVASMQEGHLGTAAEFDATSVKASHHSFWDAGITGEGQIVGVGDSGLDLNSCFFGDDSVGESEKEQERVNAPAKSRFDYPNHRKVIQYVSYADGVSGEDTSHGTHVAGSVAGSVSAAKDAANPIVIGGRVRTSPNTHKGMAYDAKLAFFDIGKAGAGLDVPPDFNILFGPSYELGARIHTNSWGAPVQYHSTGLQSMDEFVFSKQDFLPLFAAGNQGDAGAWTVGTPAIAKNIVTVGARQASSYGYSLLKAAYPGASDAWKCLSTTGQCGEDMAYFSSIGPTFDQRLKPEVNAPGYYVFSARSVKPVSTSPWVPAQPHCQVFPNAGTSMATPITAGTTALARQFFMEGYYPTGNKTAADGFTPMAALLKAVLINGAEFLKGVHGNVPLAANPDVYQGFGRVNLSKNLKLGGNSFGRHSVVVDGDMAAMPQFLNSGESKEYKVFVDKSSTEGNNIRATLAWMDPPNGRTCTKMLVNDLDLSIVSPSGKVYANADDVNNVEQIDVPFSQIETGMYTIKVKAAQIRRNDVAQPFAVVVTGDFVAPPPPTPAPTTAAPTTAAPTTAAPTAPTPAPTSEGLNVPLVAGIAGGVAAALALGYVFCVRTASPSEKRTADSQLAVSNPKHSAYGPAQ